MDCDLASYRIKWSHEVEQYFAAKQHSAGNIIRKTTPVDDDLEYVGLRMKPSGGSVGVGTGTKGESLPTAFSNKARI